MKVYRCHQVKAHELLSNELHALCRFITLSHQKKKKKKQDWIVITLMSQARNCNSGQMKLSLNVLKRENCVAV